MVRTLGFGVFASTAAAAVVVVVAGVVISPLLLFSFLWCQAIYQGYRSHKQNNSKKERLRALAVRFVFVVIMFVLVVVVRAENVGLF